MTDRILTVYEASTLGKIVDAVRRSAHVGWVRESGDISTGTLRAIVKDATGRAFADANTDIRDAYVWITTDRGFEDFKLVVDVLRMVDEMEFSLDYHSVG